MGMENGEHVFPEAAEFCEAGSFGKACGAVVEDDGEIKLYYGGADTVMCVATTTVERLIDACYNR